MGKKQELRAVVTVLRPREVAITVRMREKERSEITAAAQRSGATVASWIRLILLREARAPDPNASPEARMRAEAIEESRAVR